MPTRTLKPTDPDAKFFEDLRKQNAKTADAPPIPKKKPAKVNPAED